VELLDTRSSAGSKPGSTGQEAPALVQPHSPVATGRYLVALVSLAALVLAGIGLANYLLNPLDYDGQYTRQVAQTLVDGRNFANYDANINMRALRMAQIQLMRTTPDVIAFGGSRWQEAHAGLLTDGRSFLNAHIHNDYAEDSLALAELLYETGHLPRTLVLSERFATFEPLAQRDSADWLTWAPEYRRMAQRLGIQPHPYLSTLPTSIWAGMFSAPALLDRAQEVVVKKEAPGPTTDAQKDDMDIFASDGSLLFSRKSLAAFGGGFLKNNVRSQLQLLAGTRPMVDQGLVTAMTRLIVFLRSHGVQVVVALLPYQPDFYAGVQGHPYGASLRQIQSIVADWSSRYGVTAIGGYDAIALGCTATQFRDVLHPTAPCLAHVVGQIPPGTPA